MMYVHGTSSNDSYTQTETFSVDNGTETVRMSLSKNSNFIIKPKSNTSCIQINNEILPENQQRQLDYSDEEEDFKFQPSYEA